MAAVGVTIMLGAGCAPEMNWREVRVDGAPVSLTFPCKPVRQQRSLVLAGVHVTMVLHVCDAAGASWALAHADVADPAAVGPALRELVGAAHDNIGAPRPAAGGTGSPMAGATPHAEAGRHDLRGTAPDGRKVRAGLLVFARGTVVVQATAIGPEGAWSAAIDTFIGSVRVVP